MIYYIVLGTSKFHFILFVNRKYQREKEKESQNKGEYETDEDSQTWRTQNGDLKVGS